MRRIGCCSNSALLNAIKERSSGATEVARSAEKIGMKFNIKLISAGAKQGII
jgi:hypothetical protein